MPEEIIVESWRVAIVSSAALTRLKRPRKSPTSALLNSSISRTIRPVARSCEETACLLSASISPRVCAPGRSSALKTKVAMGRPHRPHAAAVRHRREAVARGARGAGLAEQARELLRRGGPLHRELAGDLVAANQIEQCRVHS